MEYIITNPTPDTPTVINQGAFEDPVRNYQSIELTMDKRVSNNWGLFASYRWSRLYGNFEGFYRSDNTQSDPAITSLFDFPINDPSYTEIGVPQFGFSGDIRNQGEQGSGRLPNDRQHQIKGYSTYSMDNGLGVGIGLLLSSGRPLTALAANPVYDNSGEIPVTARGAGFDTANGFKEKADFQYGLDLHVDYRFNIGDTQGLTLIADLFSTFNQQAVLRYNEWTDLSFQVADPDFGRSREYMAPFRLRSACATSFRARDANFSPGREQSSRPFFGAPGMARSAMDGAVNRGAKAKREVTRRCPLKEGSPLGTLMAGTSSRRATASPRGGVGRKL